MPITPRNVSLTSVLVINFDFHSVPCTFPMYKMRKQPGFAALDIRLHRCYGREKAALVKPRPSRLLFSCLHPWIAFTQNSGQTTASAWILFQAVCSYSVDVGWIGSKHCTGTRTASCCCISDWSADNTNGRRSERADATTAPLTAGGLKRLPTEST